MNNFLFGRFLKLIRDFLEPKNSKQLMRFAAEACPSYLAQMQVLGYLLEIKVRILTGVWGCPVVGQPLFSFLSSG